jgi:predicted aspartyl protease
MLTLDTLDPGGVRETVGEVRVRARLANPFDEMLVRRGQLPADQVHHYEADALVDMGAVRTVVPLQVLQALGLVVARQTVADYADGRRDLVGLSEPIKIEILERDTVDEAQVLGDEVLIGQTVLEKLDLLVDCTRRKLVPNPAHPDQPISRVKSRTLENTRNANRKCRR